MKYILHDTSALDDEKLTEIYINYGYEGVGLFWSVLEKIGKQEKPIKTSVLKKQLNVGRKLEKCWSFMESIGVISSNNGETFNERILSYSETYQIKKEKNKERISQWREKQLDTKNVTHYESVCNAPKVKERKVKESKESKEEITLAEEKQNILPVEKEEREKGMPPPEIEHPLLNSNLYRQPTIPTIQSVIEFFNSSGGTNQMAESFFNKNEGVGWFLRGSPITNFRNLVPGFITNWNKNEKNATVTRNTHYTSGKITGASAGLNVINAAREEFLRGRN